MGKGVLDSIGGDNMPGIHDLACQKVVDFEHGKGRQAVDVSNKHLGPDITGTRNIEVKSTKHPKIPNICYFYKPSWDWFKNDPKAWLYIVYDIEKKPKLLKLSRDDVLKLCKTRSYEEIWVKIPKELRKPIESIGAGIDL